MLEWHKKMMTFEQSIPDSITLPFDLTKMLEWHQHMVTFEQSTPDSITLPFSLTKNNASTIRKLR